MSSIQRNLRPFAIFSFEKTGFYVVMLLPAKNEPNVARTRWGLNRFPLAPRPGKGGNK